MNGAQRTNIEPSTPSSSTLVVEDIEDEGRSNNALEVEEPEPAGKEPRQGGAIAPITTPEAPKQALPGYEAPEWAVGEGQDDAAVLSRMTWSFAVREEGRTTRIIDISKVRASSTNSPPLAPEVGDGGGPRQPCFSQHFHHLQRASYVIGRNAPDGSLDPTANLGAGSDLTVSRYAEIDCMLPRPRGHHGMHAAAARVTLVVKAALPRIAADVSNRSRSKRSCAPVPSSYLLVPPGPLQATRRASIQQERRAFSLR